MLCYSAWRILSAFNRCIYQSWNYQWMTSLPIFTLEWCLTQNTWRKVHFCLLWLDMSVPWVLRGSWLRWMIVALKPPEFVVLGILVLVSRQSNSGISFFGIFFSPNTWTQVREKLSSLHILHHKVQPCAIHKISIPEMWRRGKRRKWLSREERLNRERHSPAIV